MTPTFKTTDIDLMSGIYEQTGEIPHIVHLGGGLVEGRFSDPEAPEAARKFRNDNRLQNFIAAKKTVFRLVNRAKA